MLMLDHRIEVLSDHGETKVRDPCTTGGVYKDVPLVGCQYDDETRSRMITYSLEASVNHITGVKVVEASGNIR